MNIIITIIAVIVFFIVLIVPHEFGHFITAKILGVKVNEFAFGMGPAILQKQGEETLYSVRIFPIGGYCALEGENEDTGDPRAFNSKPGWVKIIILSAGVIMNVVTAFLIMFFLLVFVRLTNMDSLPEDMGVLQVIAQSVLDGAATVGKMGLLIVDSLKQLFTGGASMDDLSGPVGIVTAVNESASQGITYYLVFTAIMCVNLAVINILPLPALDGGRILFVIIRKVTGKMITDELESRIHMIGMALLLLLIIMITFKDVGTLFR
ncbi:MAG: site-2 protease family protein [Eubacterium sp.]|nr:site-2 protease family protein [Eubacterium sp.]